MELVDGLGQLGTALSNLITEKNPDKVIYHTWNFADKSEETQKAEFEKFKKFLDSNPDKEIVFISTKTKTDNNYGKYKNMSEALVKTHAKWKIIRIPNLIGKGICNKFRDSEAEPFDTMELMTISDGAEEVLKIAAEERNKEVDVQGEKISAQMVYNLIQFGKNGVL